MLLVDFPKCEASARFSIPEHEKSRQLQIPGDSGSWEFFNNIKVYKENAPILEILEILCRRIKEK